MATPIYFPDVMAALPEPRFVEPQSNTGAIALGAGLKAITDVANNFRTKDMNVAKANQMAEALEREGLSQEANLYRSAAQSYQTNFFATPEENERFNQSLLNDTLKLLTNKQEREMKAQQLQAEAEYKNAMILNMQQDNLRAGQEMRLREQEIGLRMGDKADALAQKEQRNKMLGLDATADNLRMQAAQDQKAMDELSSLRESGSLSQDEYARRVAPIVDNLNKSRSELNNIQRTILEIQGVDSPARDTPMLSVPAIRSKDEKIAEVDTKAQKAFVKNPGLKEYREGDIVITNPAFIPPTTTSVTRGVNAEGQPFSSETVRGQTMPTVQGDPNAPHRPQNSRY